MRSPIVEVETKDGLPLYGLLSESNKNTIVINTHGTAGNFYEENFLNKLAEVIHKKGISFLSTNNRGAYVLQAYSPRGSAMEHFEDCVLDIDAWMSFVISKGYSKIILQGHSLGSEKVVYYMNKGKYKDKISAVILLGFSDSFGQQEEYDPKLKLMLEAKKLIQANILYPHISKGSSGSTSICPSYPSSG